MVVLMLTYSGLATFGSISDTLKRKRKELENRAQKTVGMNVKLPSSSKVVFKREINFVQKFLNGSTNSNFENYFSLQNSRINTRNNGYSVRLPRVKLEAARSSLFFKGLEHLMSFPLT